MAYLLLDQYLLPELRHIVMDYLIDPPNRANFTATILEVNHIKKRESQYNSNVVMAAFDNLYMCNRDYLWVYGKRYDPDPDKNKKLILQEIMLTHKYETRYQKLLAKLRLPYWNKKFGIK